MSEPLLRVENLKTQFFTESGTVRAVDGISFEVHEGEIVGLVGESGAGKSVASMSLMRLVEDPGEIVGGEITYRGETLFGLEEGPDGELRERDEMLSESEMRERIRGREIAVIFQDPMESLNPVFTVGGQLREFIELNRDLSSGEARDEAIRMLREVGIPDPAERYEEYPHQFSGGMRQRVLIAMALACEPSLIIADEPTTALDVTVEGQILDLVDDLQDRYDTSFVWVTHDMGVVAEICDRVNVMYLGEIVEQAPVDELFYDTNHPYTKALLDSMPRPDRTVDELDPIEGVMPEAIEPPSGCRFHPRCPDAREVCTRVHPETLEVDRADGYPHRTACVKHDVFDVDYDGSVPLEPGDEAETRVGGTGTEAGADSNSSSTGEEEPASPDGGDPQR
ncbi:ABC transporter ATP-binding protein [Natronolimnohabitans innermongolicus]|uniref:Nickel import system ATP-binding protein NikD n=1 Tax=Natronolimnohabitans innermongolicus JCM 12255 TaxID=1227499 RepID=L9X3F5_9EURY|nr:ABC transporter ATP-binding protein [Natronolimnohabitans innermongolicus]ELY55103.1 oligopeptide/dipeptide ABC transporter ATPase [Natronolimnohabitans innermongolicus JCM 12255]